MHKKEYKAVNVCSNQIVYS